MPAEVMTLSIHFARVEGTILDMPKIDVSFPAEKEIC